jgi:GNAT superfamily N-acetyltransferase
VIGEVDRAVPGDAPAMGAILSAWIDETPWMPRLHTPDEDRAFCAGLIGGDCLVVRDASGAPLGFLARAEHEIVALYIDGMARGRGLGRQLLGAVKPESDRLTLWTFLDNVRARAFYRREGFVEVRRTDGARNDEGLQDVLLKWERRDD